MIRKFRKKWVITISFVSLILLASLVCFLTIKNSVADGVFALRLEIPSINVNASIEMVGITSDGAMGVPAGAMTVGWYSLGPRPGQDGSAVIAGHRSWKNGEAAVFDDLDKLHKGDRISVLNSDGRKIFFVVRETRIYDKEAIVPEIFTSNDGAHLNLITCGGEWDKDLKTSTERWVVFADLVD